MAQEIEDIVPRVANVVLYEEPAMDTGMSSDSSETTTDYKPFNLREYEENESREYSEFRESYRQEKLERYIETLERRRIKMIQNNISVLETLVPKNHVKKKQMDTCDESTEKQKTDIPFSWNNIQPAVVIESASLEPIIEEIPIPETVIDKRKKRVPIPVSPVPEETKDVSDEEMLKAMTKRGSRSPHKNQDSPRNNRIQPNNQSRIRIFSTAPNGAPNTATGVEAKKSSPPGSRPTEASHPNKSSPNPRHNAHPNTHSSPPSESRVSYPSKSRMCNFKNCRRPGCGYAHTMDEFDPVHCRFNDCRRANCRFFHSGKESKEEFLVRFRNSIQQ